MSLNVPRVLLALVCRAGRLHHAGDAGDILEQGWKACEPAVVQQAHADAHPQVIFFVKTLAKEQAAGEKSVVKCRAPSTSKHSYLWEPTAPHLEIASNSLFQIRDGVLMFAYL